MINFFIRLLKTTLKRKLLKPVQMIKQSFGNKTKSGALRKKRTFRQKFEHFAEKAGKKVLNKNNPYIKAKKRYKAAKRFVSTVRRMTPKGRLVDDIMLKANIIENMVHAENEFLAQRTSTQRGLSETVRQANELGNLLHGKSKSDLKAMQSAIHEELNGLGIKSAEDISKVIDSEEFRTDLMMNNAYDSFMDSWREGFFDSGVDKDGNELSKEEKEDIWQEILEKKSRQWFDAVKSGIMTSKEWGENN